ncbi:PhzF family phenazine biosynthesis protein [Microbulbifer sp. OS29]|uniref:PhzF family phenazine biosynthesis protein n=1 Tax=Microbulbifer okhotskensis TaxID=2926617 RepID=A0A9X2J7G9_9GAMM|nr:PhzF family phenazine biosynthesis protein [Microbulbifer okhotskensis]MCO1336584.1 PhzF family phenazine biosynthesis protein [Microbulbifer okhotskensis]
MELKIHFVNAFTDRVFQGNSAAVIITEEWLDDNLMQSIATENNLSETAFLVKHPENDYKIRWFSPLTEIDFCGHATLASAHVLFSQNPPCRQVQLYADAVGSMNIIRAENGVISMNFPKIEPQPVSQVPTALIEGLSIKPAKVLVNKQAYFAIYNNEQEVLEIQQNPDILKKLEPHDVVVTARSKKYDFISRYFWPSNGGAEDPVTGSIHTGLAPYWSKILDKKELVAHQASQRGGLLNCTVTGERVIISGSAVPYLEGTIQV